MVNEVLELSRGELTRFSGNYSRYVEQREQKLLLELKNFEKQQKESERRRIKGSFRLSDENCRRQNPEMQHFLYP